MNASERTVFGVGITGGMPTKKDGRMIQSYSQWKSMLKRCYSDVSLSKNPTYIRCTVSEEWKNYEEFDTWFNDNYVDGYHLDKDIIFQGNKVYCKEYCSFVPQRINNLLTNRSRFRGDYPVGVSIDKRANVFESKVNSNGKIVRFGSFKTAKEAGKAYIKGKTKIIREVAESYYSKGLINYDVYNGLFNWKVGE